MDGPGSRGSCQSNCRNGSECLASSLQECIAAMHQKNGRLPTKERIKIRCGSLTRQLSTWFALQLNHCVLNSRTEDTNVHDMLGHQT